MSCEIPQTPAQAFKVMESMLEGKYTTIEIVSFLRFFQENPASPQLLFSFLEAVKASAVFTIDSNSFDKPVLDIAGTGGDGKNTVNISTLAGLFCAATGLVKVVKYGNRAASGICGSMDVLEAHGIPIELSQEEMHENVREHNFSPLFARSVYPGAKFVAEARSQINGPTLFNLLFPLARPITGQPKFVFGVANKNLLNIISEIYIQDKKTRCLLVHGIDETDEVSVTGAGKTNYTLIDSGQMISGVIDCQELFDITPIGLSDLQVSSKQEAISLFKEVCDPQSQSPKLSAIRQAVFANAAVSLHVALDSGNMNVLNSNKYLPVLHEKLNSGKITKLLKSLQKKEIL